MHDTEPVSFHVNPHNLFLKDPVENFASLRLLG
jgi:hypothetical protein